MAKNSNGNCPLRFENTFKELKKDQDIHITKADKSNTLVIMNKTNYLENIKEILSDTETYCELNKNPLDLVNNSFSKKIKSMFKDDDNLMKKFMSTSPNIPYMYGLIKVRKENNPVRPIISSIGSATYKLSKWLVTLVNPIAGKISEANVKNNTDLINKLNRLEIDYDFKIITFDVTSLLTRVPVNDLLEILTEELSHHNLSYDA
ncbi:uncharacterized protein LOC143019896 [Oratosquilla oratoria]|uniref:uncharacterized protein LOC143019896 n=1 Tax=Oratosquilla oratoria TaxID=337810 RepID=UPI003F769032